MQLSWFLDKSRYCVKVPDLCQKRDERHRLVWKDSPYWMVVDTEFREFLKSLDGTKTWAQLMAEHPQWEDGHKELLRRIHQLRKQGLVQVGGEANRISHHKETGTLPIESITIHITRRCNLRCSFCYLRHQLGVSAEPELRAEEIITFLDSIRDRLSKKFSLSLLGGELLLETDKLLAIAAHAKCRHWPCLVSTNGHLVTTTFASQARQLGLEVQVSLDGATARTHEAIRGTVTFDKALNGIRELTQQGTHTILSMVCHEDNVSQLTHYFDLAQDLQANEARFIPLKLIGGAQDGQIKPVSLPKLLAQVNGEYPSLPANRDL